MKVHSHTNIPKATQKPDDTSMVSCRQVSYVRLCSLGVVASFQFLEKTLSAFSECHIPILLMTSSSTNISMAIESPADNFRLPEKISDFAEVNIEPHVAIIHTPIATAQDNETISHKIAQVLHSLPILMISYDSNDHNLSLAVREKDCNQVISALATLKE